MKKLDELFKKMLAVQFTILLLVTMAIIFTACAPDGLNSTTGTIDSALPSASTPASDVKPATLPDATHSVSLSWQDDAKRLHLLDPRVTHGEEMEVRLWYSCGEKTIIYFDCPCRVYERPSCVTLGEYEFWSSNTQKLWGYREGQLLVLVDAYNANWFTANEVAGLYEHHSKENSHLYYTPDLTGLSWQDAIKTIHLWEQRDTTRPLEEIRIEEFGTYGDKYVFLLHCYCHSYIDVLEEENIGDLEFRYPSSQRMHVYREGQLELLSLLDAWQSGWLTQSELEALHSLYVAQNPVLYD